MTKPGAGFYVALMFLALVYLAARGKLSGLANILTAKSAAKVPGKDVTSPSYLWGQPTGNETHMSGSLPLIHNGAGVG